MSTSAGRDLIWITAAALAVKGGVLLQLGGHPLLQPRGDLDTTWYVTLARQVADDGLLAVREPFFLSPLYVYFLAAVFGVGGGLTAVRVAQVLLGCAAVVFIYLLCRDWFDARVARLAAMLALFTGFLTFSEIVILQSALDPILVAAALYFVSRTQIVSGALPPIAAGVLLGLFALNRPNGAIYGIAAAALIAWAGVRQASKEATVARFVAIRRATLVLIPFCLLLGANALRNYAASGEAVLISSHGGLNFYIGNNPEATGTYVRVAGVSPTVAGQVRDATRVAEATEGRPLGSAEVSRHFYGRALEWIVDRPGAAARLFARKFAILLNRTEVPLNYSYRFFQETSWLLRLLVVGPGLLVAFGLVGLALGIRSGLSYWTWASFVPIYALSVVAFFVSDRYRLPLFIPLAALTAHALVWTFDRVRERRIAAVATVTVVVVAATVFASQDLGLDDGLSGERARYATWLIDQGQHDAAQQYVAAAAADLPYAGVFHFRVGEAFTKAGRYKDAVEHLQKALAIDGSRPAIHLALGQALLLDDRPDAAAPHLAVAFDASFRPEMSAPWLVRALARAGRRADAVTTLSRVPDAVVHAVPADTGVEMGTLALEARAPAVAERWLAAARQRAPELAEAHEKFAVALLLQGRTQEALAPIERAVALAPSSASSRLNLAVVYAQLGRHREARDAARQAMRLDPSEPRAAALLKALPPDRP